MRGRGQILNGNWVRSQKNDLFKMQKESSESQKGIGEKHLEMPVFRIFRAMLRRKENVHWIRWAETNSPY
jgi:hypothetical protein